MECRRVIDDSNLDEKTTKMTKMRKVKSNTWPSVGAAESALDRLQFARRRRHHFAEQHLRRRLGRGRGDADADAERRRRRRRRRRRGRWRRRHGHVALAVERFGQHAQRARLLDALERQQRVVVRRRRRHLERILHDEWSLERQGSTTKMAAGAEWSHGIVFSFF